MTDSWQAGYHTDPGRFSPTRRQHVPRRRRDAFQLGDGPGGDERVLQAVMKEYTEANRSCWRQGTDQVLLGIHEQCSNGKYARAARCSLCSNAAFTGARVRRAGGCRMELTILD